MSKRKRELEELKFEIIKDLERAVSVLEREMKEMKESMVMYGQPIHWVVEDTSRNLDGLQKVVSTLVDNVVALEIKVEDHQNETRDGLANRETEIDNVEAGLAKLKDRIDGGAFFDA